MNDQNNGDENRGHESWLSSIARIYGPWHLRITAIQGVAWAAFVYWNESGKHAYWADTAQVVGEKTWVALPAFFITSAIILVIIQKGGRMVLTFVDERRKRIEKARAEGRAEGARKGASRGGKKSTPSGWSGTAGARKPRGAASVLRSRRPALTGAEAIPRLLDNAGWHPKGGRMVLTFVDERRKRIEKARAEGREEGRAEVREALEEAYAKWSDWNRRREEAERRGERFDELPPSLNGR